MADSWLDNTCKEYDTWEPKRRLARRHYEADVAEIRSKDLIQRKQGESDGQFIERQETSDYFPAFGTVVDSYAGQIRQAEDKVDRVWTDEETEGGGISDATRDQLLDDTDGKDTNWLSMLHEVVVTLISENAVWGIVEGVMRDEEGRTIGGPHVRPISPSAVLNWDSDALGFTWVKVKHSATVGKTPQNEGEEVDRYTIYYRDGYEVWQKVEQDGEEAEVQVLDGTERADGRRPYGTTGEGEDNGFRYKAKNGITDTLPIFRVDLKLMRYVGYVLAEKNKALFNKESERDNILRVANTPKGVYAGTKESFEEMLKIIKSHTKASNLWMLDPESSQQHYYMAPPIDSAEIASEVLMEKIETFFVAAFQFYENSVRGAQKTATEIEQDSSRGEWSFLNTVATARDEFERAAMWRVEQIENPGEPDLWGQAGVTTPKNFKPVDVQARAKELKQRYFPTSGVPIGESGRANAAKEIAELDGVETDDREVEEEVRERRDREIQAGQFGVM